MQNSVPVARMGADLGVSAFVLAATVVGFRMSLLVMIAISAGNACLHPGAARAQSARGTSGG